MIDECHFSRMSAFSKESKNAARPISHIACGQKDFSPWGGVRYFSKSSYR